MYESIFVLYETLDESLNEHWWQAVLFLWQKLAYSNNWEGVESGRSEWEQLYDTLLSCDQRFIPTAPFSPVRNELSHSSPSTWAYLWVVEKERDNVALVDEMWRELRHWFMSTTQCTGSVCCWKRDSVESKEFVCVCVCWVQMSPSSKCWEVNEPI